MQASICFQSDSSALPKLIPSGHPVCTRLELAKGSQGTSGWRVKREQSVKHVDSRVRNSDKPEGEMAVRMSRSDCCTTTEPISGQLVEKKINGGNPAVPGDDEIRSGVGWRIARAARYPRDPSAIAKPGWLDPVTQRDASHKGPGNHAQITFDIHGDNLLRLTMKYTIGTVMRESASDAISPAISAMARPWKIGSNKITAAPTTTAAAVSSIGRKRIAPASMTALSMDNPSRNRSSMKSTRMIEFLTTMPAPAMKPIMDVAVKNAPMRPCAGRMPTSENGIAAMITSGVTKDWNQPTTRP